MDGNSAATSCGDLILLRATKSEYLSSHWAFVIHSLKSIIFKLAIRIREAVAHPSPNNEYFLIYTLNTP